MQPSKHSKQIYRLTFPNFHNRIQLPKIEQLKKHINHMTTEGSVSFLGTTVVSRICMRMTVYIEIALLFP